MQAPRNGTSLSLSPPLFWHVFASLSASPPSGRRGDEFVSDPLCDVGGIGCRQSQDDVREASVERLADRVLGAAGLVVGD